VPGSGSGASQGAGGGGLDPFTGAGAYRSGSAAPTSMDTSPPADLGPPSFPVTSYLRFPQPPNFEALKGKLAEFIGTLGPQAGIEPGNIQDLLRIGTTEEWDDKLGSLVQICLDQWPRGTFLNLHLLSS
jgi:hypothetical protein